MRKGNVTIIIVLVVIIFLLAGSLFTPILLFGEFRGGQLDKPTGIASGDGSTSSIGSGCFVSDSAFTDTSAADRADEIVTAITSKWSNAKGNEDKIRELLARGKKEGINPLLPLAIWLGEQTFGSPEKAFGFGNTDSGVITGSQGWENQVNGVYNRLQKVLDNASPYNNPASANRYTRLFYNYTTAMRIVYQNSGNSWNEETVYTDKDGGKSKPHKNRMTIFHLLAPNQIECSTLASCPGVEVRLLPHPTVSEANKLTPKIIIMHYMGTKGENSNIPLTIDEMYNYSKNQMAKGEGPYVHFVIGQSGRIQQQYPTELRGAGALGYNGPTEENDIGKKYGPKAITISIENEGHFEKAGVKALQYTAKQMESNVQLVKCLQQKFSIPKDEVISHQEADVRAGNGKNRRSDPGAKFMKELLNKL